MTDLVIVGAGPAGLGAAALAGEAGVATRLLEAAPRAGGQLRRTWSPLTGVAGATSAAEWADTLERRATAAGVAAEHRAVTRLARRGRGFVLEAEGGEPIEARAVLVATGLRARTLGVPGERELEGHGVSTSASRDRDRFAGRDVAVVGGGDAAYENALLLAGVGCRVSLLVRGAPRARPEFRSRVAKEKKITVIPEARVTRIAGGTEVTGIEAETPEGRRSLDVSGVFVKIGSAPATEWCRDALRCDAEGYVKADLSRATSLAGVWAAGDVTRPEAFTLRAAAADAAIAVHFARRFLAS